MVDTVGEKDKRSQSILIGVITIYLVAIVVLALLGRYTFVFKVLVVPSLFLVAAAMRRLRIFVYDWAVFLGLIALFDTLRGLIFHLTMLQDRPVFMNYVIDAERWLGFGQIPTIVLQGWLADPPNLRFLEKFLVVVHGSHFLFFLFFALLVWSLRRDDFTRFQAGMVMVMYGGLLGYVLLPTVPPWMAANEYQAIAPIFHFPELIYNTTLPKLSAAFDTNPIAAMPSLHTAFPVYCSCVAFTLFGRRALPMLIYTLVVVFALVYAGEHYLVDSLAGAGLAAGAWALTHRVGPLAKRLRPSSSISAKSMWPRLAVAAVVLTAAIIGGNRLGRNPVRYTTSRDFITRELIGKTNSGHYYLGRHLEDQNQPRPAQKEYERAAAEMGPEAPLGPMLYHRLGTLAHDNGDHQTAVNALGEFSLNSITPATAVTLGISLAELNRPAEAVAVFQAVQQRYPDEPTTLYWMTRVLAAGKRITPQQIRQVAARLRSANGGGAIVQMADHLDDLAKQP